MPLDPHSGSRLQRSRALPLILPLLRHWLRKLSDKHVSFAGVYLTSKNPKHSTKSILRNNYDDNVSRVMEFHKNKIDYVVEVDIPKKDLVKCTAKRDVLKHEGDLDLSKLDHKIYKREKKH